MVKRSVRFYLAWAILLSALVIPAVFLLDFEPAAPTSCGPGCVSRTSNLFFGETGFKFYLILAIPLAGAAVVALLIFLGARRNSNAFGYAALVIANVLLAGAFVDTLLFFVGTLEIPAGIFLVIASLDAVSRFGNR